MKYKILIPAVTIAVLGMSAENAFAVKEGDWIARFGLTNVSPNDSSGGFSGNPAVGVALDDDTQPSFNLTYMWKNNIGIELLGALPFEHTLSTTGALNGKVATVKQLPPTLSLQYHFDPQSSLRPYASLGINYTTFFDVNTTGDLAGTTLDLDDSWGLAAQVGVDYDLTQDWFLNADLRYINIETVGTSSALGTIDVDINPWVFTLSLGTTF